jgi:iron complex outermembrane receptor protein
MTMKSYRALLTGSTSMCAVALALASPAFAQNAAPTDRQSSQSVVGLEEIIVNARRVEENVQRVPIAITAISEDKLRKQDLKDLFTLQKEVPGFSLCCNPGVNLNVFMRGIQGVVFYFSDVPTVLTGFGNFLDISNVQVLKGPQGTLFGVASNGGAVVIQPRKPGETFGGFVSATAGNYDRRTINGALDIPIIEDKVLTRVAFETGHTDGYIHDLSTEKNLGDQNYWVGRFSLILRPTEKLENYTMFQYYKDHGAPTPLGVLKFVNPTGLARTVFGPALDNELAIQRQLGPYTIKGLSTGANDGGTRYFNEIFNLSNTTTYNFTDELSLKNIFGYQLNRGLYVIDIDGTQLPIVDGSALNRVGTGTPAWSDEIQLQGTLFERLKFTVGTFHTGQHTNPTPVYSVAFGGTTAALSRSSYLTRAVYAQGTYDLSEFLDGLNFTGGYRYTWDSRTASRYGLLLPSLVGAPGQAREQSAHFSNGSWTLGVQYQYTPDTMFFLTGSKGYSSGGIGLTAPAPLRVFQPETLTNLETGVKSTFDVAGMTVRSNISAYYGFFSNVQVSVASAVQVNPPPAPVSFVLVTQNAATARSHGVEADITILPTDDFEISGTLAYSHIHFKSYPSFDTAGNPIDLSSSPFLENPKIRYTLKGTYHLPIDRERWGDMSITANYFHSAKFYFQVKPIAQIGPEVTNPPYHNLDLSFDWRDILGNDGLEGSFFVTNMTKNVINNSQVTTYDSLGMLPSGVAVPRMFGVRLRYAF